MKPGTGKDKNSLEQLYSEEVVKDFNADGSAFVSPEAQVNEPKAFANTGPKSPGTELPNPLEKKNVQEDNHFSPQDFSQNEGKMDEETINNSKLMSNEKSTFDKLYEDVMGDEGLMLTREEEDMPGMDMDMGGLDDDLGDDEGGDMVTLSLPRDLAEA